MIWALCLAAAVVYWGLSLSDGVSWVRTGVKGLAVAPLAVMALGQGAPLVALALGLCSLGDVMLSRPGERAFLGGLGAFALGHVGWIGVFGVLGLSLPAAIAGPVIALVAMLGLAFGLARVILPRAGALRGPVAVYILIILAMGAAAVGTGSATIVAGAVLFVCSDALLGLQKFVLAAQSRLERVANALIWPLYWAAIALLTLGALTG